MARLLASHEARDMDPLVLLPPSEAKRPGGAGAFVPESGQFAGLGAARRRVASALAMAMAEPASIASLTGLRTERAALAVAANRTIVGGPVRAAAERYTGVVWSHLEVAGLSARARRRARGILVVSALGGLFALDDPVPDYKLTMAARLPGLGSLASFWREQAGAVLAEQADGRVVWDLLPEKHRTALDLDRLRPVPVRVEFRAGTGSRAAGHRAKAAKGRFARHLLEARVPGLDAAASFAWEGWQGHVEAPGLVVVRAPG